MAAAARSAARVARRVLTADLERAEPEPGRATPGDLERVRVPESIRENAFAFAHHLGLRRAKDMFEGVFPQAVIKIPLARPLRYRTQRARHMREGYVGVSGRHPRGRFCSAEQAVFAKNSLAPDRRRVRQNTSVTVTLGRLTRELTQEIHSDSDSPRTESGKNVGFGVLLE